MTITLAYFVVHSITQLPIYGRRKWGVEGMYVCMQDGKRFAMKSRVQIWNEIYGKGVKLVVFFY